MSTSWKTGKKKESPRPRRATTRAPRLEGPPREFQASRGHHKSSRPRRATTRVRGLEGHHDSPRPRRALRPTTQASTGSPRVPERAHLSVASWVLAHLDQKLSCAACVSALLRNHSSEVGYPCDPATRALPGRTGPLLARTCVGSCSTPLRTERLLLGLGDVLARCSAPFSTSFCPLEERLPVRLVDVEQAVTVSAPLRIHSNASCLDWVCWHPACFCFAPFRNHSNASSPA
jgi:hypothetical protein